MALLRMTALALVACSAAEAQPNPATLANAPSIGRATYPAGWKPLPAIAQAVKTAATTEGATLDAVEAWGDPVSGCYSVSLALHEGSAPAPALAQQVMQSVQRLGSAPAGSGAPSGSAGSGGARIARPPAARPAYALAVDDVVMPTEPDGVLAFRFAAAPYRGRVRARLASGRIAATACFANQREPQRCEAACTDLVARIPDPPAPAAKGATP